MEKSHNLVTPVTEESSEQEGVQFCGFHGYPSPII